jgi:hypothetical protein
MVFTPIVGELDRYAATIERRVHLFHLLRITIELTLNQQQRGGCPIEVEKWSVLDVFDWTRPRRRRLRGIGLFRVFIVHPVGLNYIASTVEGNVTGPTVQT